MIAIAALCLSIIVILGGMLVLAKAKKEALGNIYIFSSYSAIVLGSLFFVSTVIGGICMMRCHHDNGCKSAYSCGRGSDCGSMTCGERGMKSCTSHGSGCSHGMHSGEKSMGHPCGAMKRAHKHGNQQKEIIIMDKENDDEVHEEDEEKKDDND